jgi:hypothetical protein
MVAQNPIERMGPGQVDYLLNRLADIERRLDQGGARSSFPFSVGHLGITDFQIIPSVSGDGSADILIGDGAGGKLVRVFTDTKYGTKIYQVLDQSGKSMMSTDAAAGYGLGTPSLPFVYSGRTWNQTLAGATSQATAVEVARGLNYVYNPVTYIKPIIRIASATAETVRVFCQWRDASGALNNTADQTLTVTAGGFNIDANTCQFGKLWQAADMNGLVAAFIKAYVVGGTPGNVNIMATMGEGNGVSRGFYDIYSPGWAL